MSKTSIEVKSDWPGAEVMLVPVAQLVPYARNPKKHPEAQVDQIAASIQEWGFTIPVLIDEDGGIIAFGKEDDQSRRNQPETGLMGLAKNKN